MLPVFPEENKPARATGKNELQGRSPGALARIVGAFVLIRGQRPDTIQVLTPPLSSAPNRKRREEKPLAGKASEGACLPSASFSSSASSLNS